MLLDTWYGKGNKKNLLFNVQSPVFSRTRAEMILGELLAQKYLTEDFHYTPYSTISYIKKGNYIIYNNYLVLFDNKFNILLIIGPNHYKVTNENKILMEMSQEQFGEPILKKLKSK